MISQRNLKEKVLSQGKARSRKNWKMRREKRRRLLFLMQTRKCGLMRMVFCLTGIYWMMLQHQETLPLKTAYLRKPF